MSRIEEADKVRRSIERGEPQLTYISKQQKDALQGFIDLSNKWRMIMSAKQQESSDKVQKLNRPNSRIQPSEAKVRVDGVVRTEFGEDT